MDVSRAARSELSRKEFRVRFAELQANVYTALQSLTFIGGFSILEQRRQDARSDVAYHQASLASATHDLTRMAQGKE
ncbi:MAG: hypothetical protein WAZ18_07600 [Alphaproteobacteria bacterium]